MPCLLYTSHILVIVAAWSGTTVGTLSISSGCAFAGDHPDFSVEQLTQAADLSMYARKQEYYRAKKLSLSLIHICKSFFKI